MTVYLPQKTVKHLLYAMFGVRTHAYKSFG